MGDERAQRQLLSAAGAGGLRNRAPRDRAAALCQVPHAGCGQLDLPCAQRVSCLRRGAREHCRARAAAWHPPLYRGRDRLARAPGGGDARALPRRSGNRATGCRTRRAPVVPRTDQRPGSSQCPRSGRTFEPARTRLQRAGLPGRGAHQHRRAQRAATVVHHAARPGARALRRADQWTAAQVHRWHPRRAGPAHDRRPARASGIASVRVGRVFVRSAGLGNACARNARLRGTGRYRAAPINGASAATVRAVAPRWRAENASARSPIVCPANGSAAIASASRSALAASGARNAASSAIA